MKKLILTLLAVFSLVAIPVASASAAPMSSPDFTVVSGTVTNKGKDVNNAKIIVICNNKVQKTTTDSAGYYDVSFSAKVCAPGSHVTVTATKGAKGGENSGKVSHYSADLNVSLVNVVLPELGLVSGTGAVLLGGGAAFLIRRRNLGTKAE